MTLVKQLDANRTGVVYGVHAQHETRSEGLPVIDDAALISGLTNIRSQPTSVAPQHQALVVIADPLGLLPLAPSRGGRVILAPAVFDPTPSAIEQTWCESVAPIRESPSDPPAFRAFKALGRWLYADDALIADMVGVGRTTPYTWRRDGREPRSGTAQRIYEHAATLDSLERRLGLTGMRRWLAEGVPTRRERLLQGGLSDLEADVHEALFRRAHEHRVDLAAAPEDALPMEPVATQRTLQPSTRRPRRKPS